MKSNPPHKQLFFYPHFNLRKPRRVNEIGLTTLPYLLFRDYQSDKVHSCKSVLKTGNTEPRALIKTNIFMIT